MKRTSVQKLARVLRVLVIVCFACNIIVMMTIPSYVVVDSNSSVGWFLSPKETWDSFISLYQHDWRRALRWLKAPAWLVSFANWKTMIAYGIPYIGGVCTTVILWQGKRVLDAILEGEPFSMKNAANLRRAAVCCFIISGLSLVRLIFTLAWKQSIWPLLTTNALFVPAFLVGGLLFLVMSALFRQAAELKAENDLTI